ncbi:MAG: DUF1836 domain-containing protein [Oscillospiraceae bacterium]|nr:DUF1836 domain-containing protein [Oscillospiraceae bacterium]
MPEINAIFPLPDYADLPDIELYMDQVIILMEKFLGPSLSRDGKGLTPAMVNNYVKMKALPPPVRKRYTRSHLVYLLVLCTLKPVLPLHAVSEVLHSEISRMGEEAFYRKFREDMLRVSALVSESVAPDDPSPSLTAYAPAILHSAIAARAEQALAELLLARLPEKAEPAKPAAKTASKAKASARESKI